MSQKKPHGICTQEYSQEIGEATPICIISNNMNPLQIQKVASSSAIPVGGLLGACSVTSMMVQTTSNGNHTAKQVIKFICGSLHLQFDTIYKFHELFSLKHQGKKNFLSFLR